MVLAEDRLHERGCQVEADVERAKPESPVVVAIAARAAEVKGRAAIR